MLPLTGRTVGAGRADPRRLHDGLLPVAGDFAPAAARLRHRRRRRSPTPWRRPAAAGAEFIVGPLTREEVVAAADLLTTRPPILALNFLPADRPTPERFFQFALSPEDDARAVARYIGASGRRRGVVLVPEGDWGTRVAAAFDEELRAAGGYVLGQATLQQRATRTIGASIMQVLRTDDSRARQQRIQAAIGQKLEFEPRRRPDIQFIFAPSQPADRGAPAAAATAFPSRRRHPHLHARRCLRAASHRQPGNRRRDVPGHALDAGRRRLVGGGARGGARRPSAIRPRGAAGCSPSVTTRCASRLRCNAAAHQSAGAHRHAVASMRRDACAASSSGCASRAAPRRRSNAATPRPPAATP